MAKYKLTAIVNTASMDIDHLIDTTNSDAVLEFLKFDEDTPIGELQNIKIERIED